MRLIPFRNTGIRRHYGKFSIRVILQGSSKDVRIVCEIESEVTCFAGNEFGFNLRFVVTQIEFFIKETIIVLIVQIAQVAFCISGGQISNAKVGIKRTVVCVDRPFAEGIVKVEEVLLQVAAGYTESSFFPFHQHLVVLLQ
ncbi:hypothetical protein D3C80_1546150 [compost metagenome]